MTTELASAPAPADRGGLEYVQRAALGALALLHLAGPWLVPALAAYVPSDTGRELAQDGIWALAAALVPAQTVLLVGWLVLGPGAWYLRIPAVILFLPFIWWPQAAGYENSGGQQFLIMFGATTAIGAGLMRLNGWTVDAVLDDANATLRMRFSLLSILGLMGAVAAMIVVGQLELAPFGPKWLVAWLSLSLSALAGMVAWSILAPGALWWRVLLMLVFATAFTFIGPGFDETLRMNWPFLREVADPAGVKATVWFDFSNFRGPWWTVASWTTAYVTILAATLYVLRECDFRLVTDVDPAEIKEVPPPGEMAGRPGMNPTV